MREYLDLIEKVIDVGVNIPDRTGTGRRSIFGASLDLNLRKGLPIVTTKYVHLKSVIHELLWFLRGDTNIKYLNDNGVTIWDEWADEDGELGPIYGAQWRRFGGYTNFFTGESVPGVDQIDSLLEDLKELPFSRRHIVSAWNPEFTALESLSPQENVDTGMMALSPCHLLFQVHLVPDHQEDETRLILQMYQRSADLFLGVPFNIASYAILAHLIAREIDVIPWRLIMNFGDLHLYQNHMTDAIVGEILSREPRDLPRLELHGSPKVLDTEYEDIQVIGYNPHPPIKAPIAV